MKKDGASPYIEISLDNLLHNLRQIESFTKNQGTEILAVVKDLAYGCGSVLIARTLEQLGGVRFFAVARYQEAVALRAADIQSPVLVLGRTPLEQMESLAFQNIIFTLNDIDEIKLWSQVTFPVHFHCNIDTGMGRLGLLPEQIDSFIEQLRTCKNLFFKGIFTHMARADAPSTDSIKKQVSTFYHILDRLNTSGITPEHIHFGNSATLMRYPLDRCTLVRPGIALYGLHPDPSQSFPLDLRPIASLKSTVVKLKQVEAGTEISYGGHYITGEKTWIATINLGYAHGIPRYLSNKGYVLIGSRRYQIAGNVTMDYIMVDAGGNPEFKVGDEVVAIGYQGAEQISPDEIARIGGTIGYEVLCNLSTAIDRFYLLNGSTVLHNTGYIF